MCLSDVSGVRTVPMTQKCYNSYKVQPSWEMLTWAPALAQWGIYFQCPRGSTGKKRKQLGTRQIDLGLQTGGPPTNELVSWAQPSHSPRWLVSSSGTWDSNGAHRLWLEGGLNERVGVQLMDKSLCLCWMLLGLNHSYPGTLSRKSSLLGILPRIGYANEDWKFSGASWFTPCIS